MQCPAPRIGAEIPAHATAIGKVYLAFAPDSLRPLESPLARYTSSTITDPRALASEVESVRARGWAGMRNEWIPDLAGIAVPIRVGDRLLGALAAAGPVTHFDGKHEDTFRVALVECARAIESRLNGAKGPNGRGLT